jgi:5-hydroxyisourate hydrolase-like protein (transthyretin family)
MILAAIIALLLQAAPPAAQQSTAKASIGGIVVHSGTGEPVANVRVSLARTDAPLGRFTDLVGADPPPAEVVLPSDVLAAIKNAQGTTPADQAAFASLDLEDIDEIILSPTRGVAVVSKSAPPAMTDGQGRFAFTSVEPGTYRLIFSASGYATQDYGQRVSGSAGTPIALRASEGKRDIVMRIAPVSAISGRVLDNRGQPIEGVPVQLFHFSYDETAHRKLKPAASAQTDDRGDYRFYFLSPDRYYLNAGHQPSQSFLPDFGVHVTPFNQGYLSPNRIPQNYALTYYPGAADVESATALDVQPGADLSGIDLFLAPQQVYRIRGRIVDSRTGQPPSSATLSLRAQGTDVISMLGAEIPLPPNYKPADGTFEIMNVASGSYMLTASVLNPTPQRPVDFAGLSPAERTAYVEAIKAEQLARPTGSTKINVMNSDLDGITITIGSTGSISGRFRIESPAPGSPTAFDVLRVQLKNAADFGGIASTNPLDSGLVKADGTFIIQAIPVGEYRLSVTGIPRGAYLKQAQLGPFDVLNAPLRFSGSESNTLDIVISPNAGQIEGDALDSGGQPAPGVQVVLIPDANRTRTELFRPVVSDANGHFSIDAVVPGDYKLAAWDSIEPYAFFDPQLIKQAEQNGKPIRVAESSNQRATVTVW